jgi:hypothetical protein
MIQFNKYEKWAEGYAVERILEVVVSMDGEPQTIRLEALRSFKTGRYITRAYCQRHVLLQPAWTPDPEEAPEAGSAPQELHQGITPKAGSVRIEEAGPAPIDVQLWVDLQPTLQLTNEATADAALEHALAFLQERCD